MKAKVFLSFFLFIVFQTTKGQENIPTDYMSSDFHKSRREALRASMPPNSVAVFFSNPIRNRSNDVDFYLPSGP